jgi:hypothetical protein
MPSVRAHDCIGAIRLALEAPANEGRMVQVVRELAGYAPATKDKERLPMRLLCRAIQNTTAQG